MLPFQFCGMFDRKIESGPSGRIARSFDYTPHMWDRAKGQGNG
ncbi:hypothetical protein TR2A62_1157 [Thalassobium sp. R2A62]|nr:hypothetical protein TR2A62_1157 [Thalassobium sp. R2A62]